MKSRMFVAVGAVGCALLARADSGQFGGIGISCYVQDGLLALYDGIENAGAGLHDATSRVWRDLSDGGGAHHIELLDGDQVLSDRVRLVRGVRTAAGALADAYRRMTFEFNGRPVEMDAVGDWSSQVVNVPNVGYLGWQGKQSGYNGFTMARPMTLTGTYSDKYNVRSYNSGYAQLADIVSAGVWQTYSGSPSSGKAGGGNDPVFVNGKSVARTTLNWEGGSRTDDLKLTVGGEKVVTEIRSLRVYGRQLTEDEAAQNAAVDRMRFDGATSEDVGYKWSDQGLQIALTLESARNCEVSVDGADGVTSGTFWRASSAEVTLTPQPEDGKVFLCWKGDVDGLTVGEDGEITLSLGRPRRLRCYFIDEQSGAAERSWTGASGDGLWSTAGNWSPSGSPVAGDVVTIPSGKKVCVAETTPVLSSLTVDGTLMMTNWTTCVRAGDFTIAKGGVVQPVCAFKDNEMSNRVWIACDRLTIASGGKIEATKLGYRTQCGPTWAGVTTFKGGQAASYGGAATPVGETKTYGSVEFPSDPGSGGQGTETAAWISNGWIRYGGGAVRLEVSGALVVDGEILSRGTVSGLNCGGAGSGGAVWVTCKTVEGTGAVSVRAMDNASRNQYSGAGGGRIAVHYDPIAQKDRAHACHVAFDARGGTGSEYASSDICVDHRLDGSIRPDYIGKNGTLYFTDNQFLTNGAYLARGWRFSGEWHSPEPLPATVSVPGDFLFDDCNLTLPMTGFTVGGSLTAKSSSYARACRVAFTNGVVFTVAGDAAVSDCWMSFAGGGSLSVGGDFLVSSSRADNKYMGQVNVTAVPTNGTAAAYGYEVSVGGSLTVGSNGYFVVAGSGTDGAIVKLGVGNLFVYPSGWLSADLGGWNAELGPGTNGKSLYGAGACHGGLGGAQTVAGSPDKRYDDLKHPVLPGSGGGEKGGGVIYAEVANALRVDGTISADGNHYLHKSGPSGSGGTVNLSCQKLLPSTGVISADGGWGGLFSGAKVTSGGGGRVALWMCAGETNGLTMKATGPAYQGTLPANWVEATDGTVYVGYRKGFMLLIR